MGSNWIDWFMDKPSFNINWLILFHKGKVGLPSKSQEIFHMIEHPDSVSFAAMSNYYFLF